MVVSSRSPRETNACVRIVGLAHENGSAHHQEHMVDLFEINGRGLSDRCVL